MKNKILLALAFVAISIGSFAQSAPGTPQQMPVPPAGEAMLYLIKGIKMEYISKSWTNAPTWIHNAETVADASAASKLMTELSNQISDDALSPAFKSAKNKWAKSNAKVSSNAALKQSLKDFAAGIDPAAFIPEFNMADWNYMLDKL